MKTLRILALTSLVAGFGFMTGCDTTASSSAPVIDQFEATFDEANTTWTSGLEIEFYGKASDDNNLTKLSLDFIDASGKATLIKSVAVSGSSVKFGINESVKFQITNPGTWAATGSYKIRLTATDNDGLTSSKELTFKEISGTGSVTPTPTTLASAMDTLGGTSSSFGSYLDADAMVVYKSSAAAANAAAIDLVFNNTADGKNEIRSPSDASWLTWSPKNTSKMNKVSVDYDATNTQAKIDALYNAGTASVTLQGIVAGDVVVVHTSAGKNVLIKIVSLSNTGAANVVFYIKGYK
jgi:hypothetical protein